MLVKIDKDLWINFTNILEIKLNDASDPIDGYGYVKSVDGTAFKVATLEIKNNILKFLEKD